MASQKRIAAKLRRQGRQLVELRPGGVLASLGPFAVRGTDGGFEVTNLEDIDAVDAWLKGDEE